MILTENIEINGRKFLKNYSDQGFMIERDGVRYNEAIDPIQFTDRDYIETDIKIVKLDIEELE